MKIDCLKQYFTVTDGRGLSFLELLSEPTKPNPKLMLVMGRRTGPTISVWLYVLNGTNQMPKSKISQAQGPLLLYFLQTACVS